MGLSSGKLTRTTIWRAGDERDSQLLQQLPVLCPQERGLVWKRTLGLQEKMWIASHRLLCVTSQTLPQPSSTSTSTESPSTTVELPSCEEVDCKGNGDLTSYPGDRHKYFKCVYQDGVDCFLEEHSCGDWFFDPTTDSCHNHE